MATIFVAKEVHLSVGMAIVLACALLVAGYGFADARFGESHEVDKTMWFINAANGAFLGGLVGAVLVGVIAAVQAVAH